MLISLNWLSHYIDLADKSVEEIAHALNMLGFEVEEVRETGLPQLDKVVVGQVLQRGPTSQRRSPGRLPGRGRHQGTASNYLRSIQLPGRRPGSGGLGGVQPAGRP